MAVNRRVAMARAPIEFYRRCVSARLGGSPRRLRLAGRARAATAVVCAPRPWGPWRLVHHDPRWETPHTAYLPQVPTPWLDADGLGGWMVFSGDWNGDHGPDSYYGFMTRHFRFKRLEKT